MQGHEKIQMILDDWTEDWLYVNEVNTQNMDYCIFFRGGYNTEVQPNKREESSCSSVNLLRKSYHKWA